MSVSGRTRTAFSVFGVAALAAYCSWWLFWLCRGMFPPAPFLSITGLPAPTTGLTRSLVCLFKADVSASLRWNPLAVPIVLLFVLSLGWLFAGIARKRKAAIPSMFLPAWLIVLAVAWLAKLLGSPRYW